MKTAVIVFFAIVLCVNALCDDEVRRQWQEFQQQYQKSYRSPVEVQKRYAIFKQHLEEIDALNKLYDEGRSTWKAGINQFSDLTDDEMKQYMGHGILSAFTSEEQEIQRKWNEFQETYKKSYRSGVEAKKRFEIFKNNIIRMEEHNDLYKQGLVSDKQGINQFSDWSEEEFKQYINKGLTPKDSPVEATEDDDMVRRWKDFQKKYAKTYKSEEEAQRRFEIFKENVRKIDEHNALYDQGKTTFKQDINQFSDWTHDEMVDYLMH